jgi:poly(beta-D-mannuronate) lyase
MNAMFKSGWFAGLILFTHPIYAHTYEDSLPVDIPTVEVLTSKDACQAIPVPMVSVSVRSVYLRGDSTQSHIDRARKQTYDSYMAPLWNLIKINSDYASRYKASGNPFFAHCAIDALARWASADALSNVMTPVAQLNMGRNLSGIALAYRKIRGVADGEQRAIIDSWLHRLAGRIPSYFGSTKLGETAYGNLRYWNGLACATIGDIVGDQHLIAWGLSAFHIGMKEVDGDGALPIEMKRGVRALSYQIYATAPLVMLAVVAKAHGVDVDAQGNGALARLVKFTLISALNPVKIIKKSGSAIAPYKKISGEKFAWIKIYEDNFGPVGVDEKLVSGPFYDPFLGGNLE